MKKVALIYSKNISDLTGVSAVMRSFAENKDLFKKNGIELSVYSRENICNKSQILKEARRSNNLKQRIKSKISQFITKHAKKHSLFAFLKIYIASIRMIYIFEFHLYKWRNGVCFICGGTFPSCLMRFTCYLIIKL